MRISYAEAVVGSRVARSDGGLRRISTGPRTRGAGNEELILDRVVEHLILHDNTPRAPGYGASLVDFDIMEYGKSSSL